MLKVSSSVKRRFAKDAAGKRTDQVIGYRVRFGAFRRQPSGKWIEMFHGEIDVEAADWAAAMTIARLLRRFWEHRGYLPNLCKPVPEWRHRGF